MLKYVSTLKIIDTNETIIGSLLLDSEATRIKHLQHVGPSNFQETLGFCQNFINLESIAFSFLMDIQWQSINF